MKTNALIITLLLIPFLCTAQLAATDLIVKLDGDSLHAQVLNMGLHDLTYSFPGETVTYTISKNVVEKVKFVSGRVERINERVSIAGESDWKKVKIAAVTADIVGLQPAGRVLGIVNGPFGRSPERREEMALEAVQRKAAEQGCHVVLIESRNIDPNNRLVITGAIYKF